MNYDGDAPYAGDLTASAAWDKLADGSAQLVDVRTEGEWQHIGVPKVSGAPVVFISWSFADGSLNPSFLGDVRPLRAVPLVLICRSGRRSVDAAVALTQAGFTAFNVLDGFEAPGGWRASGLPWRTGWTREDAAENRADAISRVDAGGGLAADSATPARDDAHEASAQ